MLSLILSNWKIVLTAALCAVLMFGYAYVQNLQGRLETAKTDAAAYRQVAIQNYRYIEKYNQEKAANDQWEAEANNEAEKIVNTGCEVMPKSFRDWLKWVQPSERATAR